MEQIISNKIQCLRCADIIESKHVHDFRMCKCGSCGVDGGLYYARRIGKDFKELSEYAVKSEIEK